MVFYLIAPTCLTKCLCFLDPPSKPEVTNVTRTTVSLKWSAPLNDGGSPIVGYIIERKPYTLTGEGRWLKCNYTNVTDTFYTVTALGEGEPYEFRVIAKNANQVFSTPSESTGSVQCKTDFGKICNSNCDSITPIQHTFILLTLTIPKLNDDRTMNLLMFPIEVHLFKYAYSLLQQRSPIQSIHFFITIFLFSTQQSLQRPSWIVNSCPKP